jgi:(2Fe-2S) ferredoxin
LGKHEKNDSSDGKPLESARRKAEKQRLSKGGLTVFICGDEKTAKCATAREMHESWKHLRELVKLRRKLGLTPLLALRIECPGVCRFGPVAGVFPRGAWFGGCTPDVIDQIIEQESAAIEGRQSPKSDLTTNHQLAPYPPPSRREYDLLNDRNSDKGASSNLNFRVGREAYDGLPVQGFQGVLPLASASTFAVDT